MNPRFLFFSAQFQAGKEGITELKDFSGKSVKDLSREEFDKLFCQHCHEYQDCPRDRMKIIGCKAFVDTGMTALPVWSGT